MNVHAGTVIRGAVCFLAGVVFLNLVTTGERENSIAAQTASRPEQEYVGTGKCAPCHFQQFKDWREEGHAKALENLPEKYKQDANCLSCHTTGHGAPSGYKDTATTASLAGVTCEACHGPGSQHVTLAQRFVEIEITEEGEQQLRATIQNIKPDNSCTQCHLSKAHKDPHPEFDREG